MSCCHCWLTPTPKEIQRDQKARTERLAAYSGSAVRALLVIDLIWENYLDVAPTGRSHRLGMRIAIPTHEASETK